MLLLVAPMNPLALRRRRREQFPLYFIGFGDTYPQTRRKIDKLKELLRFSWEVLQKVLGWGVECGFHPMSNSELDTASSFPCILQCLVTPALENPS